MVEINQTEAKYLRENGNPERVHITRTMKQDSKREHYFLCEEKETLKLLDTYRKTYNVLLTYGNIT